MPNANGAKWIRRTRRLAIYMRDGFCCVYCGRSLLDAKPKDITLDHVNSDLVFGLPDNRNTNLVTCCVVCNKSKSDLSLSAWLQDNPGRFRHILGHVSRQTGQPVPTLAAIAILKTTKPKRRLTVWATAVQRAQDIAVLLRGVTNHSLEESQHEPDIAGRLQASSHATRPAAQEG